MEISQELFQQQRRPRFGTANPERMQMAFGEWMVLGGEDISRVRKEPGFRGFTAYHARDVFKASRSREDGPVWTFSRYGATRTELPDGRVICVAGEHEDFYDVDFCIYNDVIVLTPSNQLEIYGYPSEVFPSTDFHTATLIQDRLFIIGSLGYKNARRPAETPVYILNLSGYRISKMPTSGEAPGWIHEHVANLDSNGVITIRGGRLVREQNGKQVLPRNFDDYSLDFNTGVWRRVTHRRWHQFRIRQEDGKLFVLKQHPSIKSILPGGAQLLPKANVNPEFTRIRIEGISVAVNLGVSAIEIIVEEDLPEAELLRLADQIRAKAEAAIHKPCILEKG